MSSKFRLARAAAAPLAAALALSAPSASAMTSYVSPGMVQFASATSAQPVAYHYWRRHHYYGAGGAFAFATLGMIAAMAAASSDECGWGGCDYGYDTGGPYYGRPYYGGWGGYRHWGGHQWEGHHHWEGSSGRHAFSGGGESWRRRR